MPSDTTTFAAAFGAMFGLLAWYLWRLEQAARRLERRVATLQRQLDTPTTAKNGSPPGKEL